MLNFTLKTPALTGLACAALSVCAFGDDVPRKQPVGRYATLWTNSPICEPPPPPPPVEVISELDDFTLAGVSPVNGGYSVILINKKERDKRVHLLPGMANSEGFTVKSVRQDPVSSKNTTVEVATANGKAGWVGYEEKYLALKPGAAAANPAAKPAATPGGRPPNPATPAANPASPQIPGLTNGRQSSRSSTGSAPRVRRVPTPPTK
jgi:hypothetical protein